MKNLLNCKVVMRRTEKASNLYIETMEELAYSANPIFSRNESNQHLYLISDRNIKEGDWYIDDTYSIRQSITSDKDYWNRRNDYKKIEATTDITLKITQLMNVVNGRGNQIPSIPQSFIEAYAKADGKIYEVKIELDKIYDEVGVYIDDRIKTREDNTVIIHPIKSVCDDHEMYLNMQYYMEHCQRNGYVTPQDWIEKHKHF